MAGMAHVDSQALRRIDLGKASPKKRLRFAPAMRRPRVGGVSGGYPTCQGTVIYALTDIGIGLKVAFLEKRIRLKIALRICYGNHHCNDDARRSGDVQ